MSTADVAVALLGVCTGYASTVWLIVGWSAIRIRHYGLAGCYLSLVSVNVLSTVILISGLVDHPIQLPRGSVTVLLIPLIALPPAIQHRAWLASRKVIGKVQR